MKNKILSKRQLKEAILNMDIDTFKKNKHKLDKEDVINIDDEPLNNNSNNSKQTPDPKSTMVMEKNNKDE